MNYQVRFLAKEWDHHSAHSGYHQLIHPLGTKINPLDLSSVRYTWIPGRVAVMLAKCSGVEPYDYAAFFYEWAAFKDMVTQSCPTIYHVLYGDESLRYLGQMRFRHRHRVVATYHQPASYLESIIPSRNYLRSLDAVIVVSKSQLPFFSRVVDADRLFWVPHGVNTKVFTPSVGWTAERSDQKTCLFVGMHKRDFNTLIKAMEIIGEKRPDIQFQVVTAQSNEHLFLGRRNLDLYHDISESELVTLYQNATLLLQPLHDSTANNAILEAMSCGLPAVISDVGGVRDYVNEQCAALTPPQDAEAMAKVALALLADHRRLAYMATEARAHALQYDWELVAADMQRVYETILQD